MANKNKNLHAAKTEKNDEFYTQLSDIEKELRHYREQFKGKTVLCNCDDPRVSQFFNYFFLNFKFLGLKRLIATCYKNQEWTLFSDGNSEKAVYIIYEGPSEENKDNPMPQDADIEVRNLIGDGDFRSAECRAFLEIADIVVTNPPFSLFREFVALMMKYEKKFLIVGNKNAITYKEIFPYIMSGEIKLGVTSPKDFYTPEQTVQKFGNIGWFTNLELNNQSKEPVILTEKYSPEKYPKYDNYDAINIDKTVNIPVDYYGVMGVPFTFIDKWNPGKESSDENIITTDDFEIIGIFNHGKDHIYDLAVPVLNKKILFKRLAIKRKTK